MAWKYPNKKFIYTKRVLIKPTNFFGNVYFSNFIEWQGEARESLLLEHPEAKNFAEHFKNLQMITHSTFNKYLKSIFFGMVIDIEVQSSYLQPYSFVLNFDYLDFESKELVSQGWQKICFFDAQKKAFAKVPQMVLDLIKPIQKV